MDQDHFRSDYKMVVSSDVLNHVRRCVITKTPMAEFEWSTSIVNDAAMTETQPETEPDSDSPEAITPTSSSSGSPPVASPALPCYPTRV